VGCSRAHPRESDLKRESQRVTDHVTRLLLVTMEHPP
jgi:hypothetical protein